MRRALRSLAATCLLTAVAAVVELALDAAAWLADARGIP